MVVIMHSILLSQIAEKVHTEMSFEALSYCHPIQNLETLFHEMTLLLDIPLFTNLE